MPARYRIRPTTLLSSSPAAETAAPTAPGNPDAAAHVLALRLHVTYLPPDQLAPPPRALRKHSKRQLAAIQASVAAFGVVKPIVIDAQGVIVAGYGLWLACKALGHAEVPTIRVDHLTPEQIRLYRIADNRLAELSSWDDDLLRLEFGELDQLDLDGTLGLDLNLELTGFATSEIDRILAHPAAGNADPEDAVPEPAAVAVSHPGDLWLLGRHKLICGDALQAETYATLLGDERAEMVFADPPYNVPINGHVSGKGKHRHREFAMASGEMNTDEFIQFLTRAFTLLRQHSTDGSIHFHCMDWRHMREILAAGATAYTELKNLLVWVKDNAGMGTFYRSQHELIFAFKAGTAPHINNFGLGETGRWRANVWQYPGANSFQSGREQDLARHPTPKPVGLVADALRDCSRRGGIVLDPFGGSGTTLIAAERTGRRARLIELDPLYIDVTIRRWQELTGQQALLAATGESFAAVTAARTTAPHAAEADHGA